MELLLAIGIVIGLVLGLTGAGGSVFAVPLLILLAEFPINAAVGIALGAVAASALFGTLSNWRSNSILWIPALTFSVSGALMAPVGKAIGQQLPETLLLSGFTLLAIIISVRMWVQAQRQPQQTRVLRSTPLDPKQFKQPMCRLSASGQFQWRPKCISGLILGGAAVGLLTGLFGVGGGFLIVPLLVYLSQVSMQQAIGTSLFVITAVSSAGFISFAADTEAMDWLLMGIIVSGGIVGMVIGRLIGQKVSGPNLQKLFSLSLIAVSLVTLAKQLLYVH